MGTLERWFLGPAERGNPATGIDRQAGGHEAWTTRNRVTLLIHGGPYFERLLASAAHLEPGDSFLFADWRGDTDEFLSDDGPELGALLSGLARRGVDVRGLVWRSHPDEGKFSEQQAVRLADAVNEAGGEMLLDERVRHGGSHHQKLVLLRHRGRPDLDVAFAGGIDLCHGRRDDERHRGDPQTIDIDARYGPRPAWHDAQLQIEGPAIADLETTFRERWDDLTPLDHRNPARAAIRRMTNQPRHPHPLPGHGQPPPVGSHTVQVLRTYPCKRPPYPFAPDGERSVARAYIKAFGNARSLIYLEDQYMWSKEVAWHLAEALRRSPDLRLIAVVPRHPDRDGRVSGPPYRFGQEEAIKTVRDAGGDRAAIYDLEREDGFPIYVHAKVCVIDDVWAAVGSDNMNRRSWTHDSEISCAVIDDELDPREPTEPGASGDRARVFARELRLTLWREHLGPDVDVGALLDPQKGFEAWHRTALDLDEWYRLGRAGPRPRGRARFHQLEPIPAWARWWSKLFYASVVDPDGRPRALRRTLSF